MEPQKTTSSILPLFLMASCLGLLASGCQSERNPDDCPLPWSRPQSWEGKPRSAVPGAGQKNPARPNSKGGTANGSFR